MEKQRLSKVLAASDVASRRACEELIFDGKVTVNGQVATLPQTMVSDSDIIAVNGRKVRRSATYHYYMLNKPRGYICSATGTESSKLVLDLFQDVSARLFTAGRLDKETEGLLIVTNDGHFANKIIHPSFGLQKEYLLKSIEEVEHEHLVTLSKGTLVQGERIVPLRVTKVRRGTIKIIVGEGKKHEVRLLAHAAGLTIKELTRIRLGNLRLGSLSAGSWRSLTEAERQTIFD